MKIGILTLPLHTNYGGILQAYALQTVLQRMGHDVIIFNKDRDIHRSTIRQSLTAGKFFVNKYILRKDVSYYTPRKKNEERREREQYTQLFIDKYINTYTIRNLATDVPKNLDAIVVGSDQVWRRFYFNLFYHCCIENAFLKFAEQWHIKRIAYAASFGTDDWECSVKETKKCTKLIKKFDAVSVREASGVELCKNRLCYNDAKQVLDPTLLLEKVDYIQLVKRAGTPPSPGNLLCYVLDTTEGKQLLIDKISRERALIPFYVNSRIDDSTLPQRERIQPPLEQWLRGFMDAEFVITDSFHACVFSIIFGKPFIVIGNKERGIARIQSLLRLFTLENHLLFNYNDYKTEESYKIDSIIQERLENLKSDSIKFLSSSISSNTKTQ